MCVRFVVVVTGFILHRTDPFRKLISSCLYLSYSQAPKHACCLQVGSYSGLVISGVKAAAAGGGRQHDCIN